MEGERERLLKEAQQGQQILMTTIKQEVGLPIVLNLDISMAQLKGLITLANHPGGTVGQFADTLHIGRSAASLLINRLVHDGLVERTDDSIDRRKMVLCLSPRGENLVAQFHQGQTERDPLPAWLEQLNEKDLRALVQGLRALTHIIQVTTGVTDPQQPAPLEEESIRTRKTP